MRYSKEESTYITAVFDSGDTVTIDIYDLSDNSQVVAGASCTEIGTTGVFKYLFSQTATQKKEYLWIMSNGSYSKYGKIVLGGWMDTVKDKVENNLDVAVSTRSSHTPSDIDTQLSSTHGSGNWEGIDPADVWSYTTRTLTSLSGQPVQDIDNKLSTSHGSSSWEGATASDVADAVWDEKLSDHQQANSTGYRLKHITGGLTRTPPPIWTRKEKEQVIEIITKLSKKIDEIDQLPKTEDLENLREIIQDIVDSLQKLTNIKPYKQILEEIVKQKQILDNMMSKLPKDDSKKLKLLHDSVAKINAKLLQFKQKDYTNEFKKLENEINNLREKIKELNKDKSDEQTRKQLEELQQDLTELARLIITQTDTQTLEKVVKNAKKDR